MPYARASSDGDCSPGGTPAIAGVVRSKQPSDSVADHTAAAPAMWIPTSNGGTSLKYYA